MYVQFLHATISLYIINAVFLQVIWTGKPCQNFHLLISVAILDTEKNTLIENNFGFTEVLKVSHNVGFTGSL